MKREKLHSKSQSGGGSLSLRHEYLIQYMPANNRKQMGKMYLLLSSKTLRCRLSPGGTFIKIAGSKDWNRRKTALNAEENAPEKVGDDDCDDKDGKQVWLLWLLLLSLVKVSVEVLWPFELLESFRTKRGTICGRISVHRSLASLCFFRCNSISCGHDFKDNHAE